MKAAILIVCLVALSVRAGDTNSVVSTNIPTLAAVVTARTNDAVTISFDSSETIRVEGRITLPEEFDSIASIPSLSNSTPFLIEAAPNVRHRSIRHVMDSLSKQHFWKIRLRELEAQQPPAN